jgi:hypothetical protein
MSAPTEIPIDVPVADAAEQAREIRPAEPADAQTAPPRAAEAGEAAEYDAVEQSLEVADDEDEYR